MASEKATRIRVETHSFSVVRMAGSAINSWCEECAAATPLATPEYAAQLRRTTPRTIYQRIESGELHFIETSQGELLVCLQSLQLRRS